MTEHGGSPSTDVTDVRDGSLRDLELVRELLGREPEGRFEVVVRDSGGQPVNDADVSVTFFMAAMPAMNMPAMKSSAKLPPAGGGIYRGSGQIIVAGRWDVTVEVSRAGQRLGSRQFAVVAR